MNDTRSFSDIINQIIKLTRNGELKWEKSVTFPLGLLFKSGGVAEVFMGKFKERKLRLYQTKGEPNFILELIDDKGDAIWEFPSVPEMKDLGEAVKFQLSNVKEFIDSLFEDK